MSAFCGHPSAFRRRFGTTFGTFCFFHPLVDLTTHLCWSEAAPAPLQKLPTHLSLGHRVPYS
jgi:hypothetical protein